MRFHATTERASRTAKRLRDTVNAHRPSREPFTLVAAQGALAAAWGYSNWAELLHTSENAPRSPLDEDAGIAVAAERADGQADAIAKSLDVDLALARAIVADAGLTARTPPDRRHAAPANGHRDRDAPVNGPAASDADAFADAGPLTPAIVGSLLRWAGERLATEVRFEAGRVVEADLPTGTATVTRRPLSRADVEAVVGHAYGEAGLSRIRLDPARAAHDFADLFSYAFEPPAILRLGDRGDIRYRVVVKGLAPHERDGLAVTCSLVTVNASSHKGLLLGNVTATGEEAWLTTDEMRQHICVLGGTASSARSSFLFGLMRQAISNGSGCLMMDASGDASRGHAVRAMARSHGRGDDVLVIDLVERDDRDVPSNTINPFSTGMGDVLTQMVVSLINDTDDVAPTWRGKATAMFVGLMRALVHLRDNGLLELDVGTIRDHLGLHRIIDLTDEAKHPELPTRIRKSISSYLTSLPDFQPERGHGQAQSTLDLHGYLEMQFTRILGTLADRYGHVFLTPRGDVDMFDVVLNRRVLLVLLPPDVRTNGESALLGRFVVASLKRMMGATLGNQIEGAWLDVVDRRMTTSDKPFVVLLDEVGRYCVEGMDLMAAQARSLGFSMAYGAGDEAGMRSLDRKILGSIIGNTNTKVVLGIDEEGTAATALGIVDKAYKPMILAGAGGWDASDGQGMRERITTNDVMSLGDGEAFVFSADRVERVTHVKGDLDGGPARKAKGSGLLKMRKPKPRG